jgi:hypothetical protein
MDVTDINDISFPHKILIRASVGYFTDALRSSVKVCLRNLGYDSGDTSFDVDILDAESRVRLIIELMNKFQDNILLVHAPSRHTYR